MIALAEELRARWDDLLVALAPRLNPAFTPELNAFAETLDKALAVERASPLHKEAGVGEARRLVAVADAVGIKYFDTDTISDEVQEMQDATAGVFEALRQSEQHRGEFDQTGLPTAADVRGIMAAADTPALLNVKEAAARAAKAGTDAFKAVLRSRRALVTPAPQPGVPLSTYTEATLSMSPEEHQHILDEDDPSTPQPGETAKQIVYELADETRKYLKAFYFKYDAEAAIKEFANLALVKFSDLKSALAAERDQWIAKVRQMGRDQYEQPWSISDAAQAEATIARLTKERDGLRVAKEHIEATSKKLTEAILALNTRVGDDQATIARLAEGEMRMRERAAKVMDGEVYKERYLKWAFRPDADHAHDSVFASIGHDAAAYIRALPLSADEKK